MEEAGGWAGLHITEGSDYNRVLNNTFIGKDGPGDLIWLIDSSYNLIEGNDFHYGTHQCVDIQSRKGKARWNIVRNNVVQNLWHTGLAAYPNADRTLIEGNVILDCGRDHKENKSGSERDRNMAIDYESNRITVDQNISWREGVGVSRAYRGSAPDIGAHEYGTSE